MVNYIANVFNVKEENYIYLHNIYICNSSKK